MRKNSNTSFLGELLKRRVPQIVGLYIAATWMMIEIGDWMVERFQLPSAITSYIFVGMVVFIPSIFYLAYQYGKPGRDPWKKPTALIVPLNLIFSITAMFYFVSPVEATETKTVVDEKGVAQTFEVPKKEYHKTMINFFWKNETGDSSLDWLQYGLPWLLDKDLERSLFISGNTPLTSSSMIREMKDSGFESAIRVPRSLKYQLAKNRFYHFSTNGKLEKVGKEFKLTVELFDVISNKKISQHQVQGVDYLALIDELTVALKSALKIPNTLDEQSNDLPVIEHTSESKTAIKLYVDARKKIAFDEDYAGAYKLLQEAVKEDFSFASAFGLLARVQQLYGSGKAAKESLEKALKHEYKLTTQERFRYKADTYAVSGNYEMQVKVYDMWIELLPDDIAAHRALSTILRVTGLDYQKALKSLKKVRELDPKDDSVLRELAQLHLLNGKMDKAAFSLETYIKNNPQDTRVIIELADVYERNGEFDRANNSLDKVLLLDSNSLSASLKQIRIMIKQGQFSEAEEKLDFLLQNAENPREKYSILETMLKYRTHRGEIAKTITLSEQMEQNSAHQAPIIVIFQVKFQRAIQMAYLGNFNDGLALIESLKEQLQSPLVELLDIGELSIAILEEDIEKAEKLIVDIQNYFKSYPNPIFESALDSSLGHMARLKKDYPGAIEYYQKSLDYMLTSVVNVQSNEELLDMQVQLAAVKHEAGNTEEALALIEDTLIKFPSMPSAFLQLATIYLDRKEFSKAKDSLEKLETIWQNADRDYLEYKKLEKLKERIQGLQNQTAEAA